MRWRMGLSSIMPVISQQQMIANSSRRRPARVPMGLADVQAAESRQCSRSDYPRRPIRLPGVCATGFLWAIALLASITLCRLSPQRVEAT